MSEIMDEQDELLEGVEIEEGAFDVRALVDLHERVLQKHRVAFGNRLSAVESGRDPAVAGVLGRKILES